MAHTVSHYRIVRKIGSGGMGEVFLAEDDRLRRQVALKMLPAEQGADRHRLQRFLREAYAASSLTHPNIAVIYEAGETEEKAPFIAMEYVDGEGLDSRLSRGALPTEAVVELGLEIADALEEAHAKGIVHRDLKPSNVMITLRGHAKVLDFGLAKMTMDPSQSDDSDTLLKSMPGVVLGTIFYMSPEQALGHTLDHRSDIFSFGALLYEMATGQRAFQGKTSTETFDRILHQQPMAALELNPGIPGGLDRVIRKCMEKDREERYQSSREIVVDLTNLRRDRSAEHPPRPAETNRRSVMAVASAIGLLALAAAAWLFFHPRNWSGTSPVDSLAVLPFANADSKTEFLSDGITESIIDSLAQLPQLKVMSRSSVFRFKGGNSDPQEAGRQLKVRAIVAGRLVQVGDRLTVGAELIDAADGRQLWGRQFDRRFADVLSLQGEISRDISEQLRIKLTGEERQRLNRSYTRDPEAYALYLKGRYDWNKRTVPDLRQAIEFFQQAAARDPNFALAYVGLADCYAFFQLGGISATYSESRARAAVRKALEIDDSVAEAHATLGMIELNGWNLDAAERELRRAIELNPSYATAHQWYALSLQSLKRPDEALAEIRKARQLDPFSAVIDLYIGVSQWLRGHDDEAIREYKSTIDLDPKFGWGYVYIGRVYAARGQCDKAMEALRTGVQLTGKNAFANGYYGYALARCGDRSGAQKLASKLAAGEPSHIPMAIVYSGLGQTDKVFAELEAAYRQHDAQLVYLAWGEPELRTIRSDPRYFDLARRIGIPP
jgi:serine/threonine protein kinase/tetratricopeptide (TPR) repeat protein